MPQPQNSRENPLRNWLPNTSLTALRQEMSDLVESFFGDSLSQLRGEQVLRVDVSESAHAVEIITDVPGYRREEIQVEVDEKSLTISGSHSEETPPPEEGRKFHRLERRSGSFSRTVWLPCPVDEQKIEARLANGILKIVLPKTNLSRRRKIDIKEDESITPPPST